MKTLKQYFALWGKRFAEMVMQMQLVFEDFQFLEALNPKYVLQWIL
jgi:hypothetical protein